MPRDFLLSDLGSGLQEGEIVAWHVSVGDLLSEGQALCDVETEKAIIEVPAPFEGVVLEIAGPVGTVVPVGGVLARIGDSIEAPESSETDGSTPAHSGDGGDHQPAAKLPPDVGAGSDVPAWVDSSGVPVGAGVTTPPSGPSQAPRGSTGGPPAAPRSLATPLARRIARRQAIDLAQVVGTGVGGRICRKDLDAVIAKAQAGAAAPVDMALAAGPGLETSHPGERVRLSKLRRTIAEHMTAQWRTVPHITGHTDADATRLLEARRTLGNRFDRKVPVDALLMAASIPALRAFPAMNATVDGDELLLHAHYDVGFAVGTKDGLVVPVVRDADQRSLRDLVEAVADLSRRALDRKLAPDEQGTQTFTISNIGPVGASHATQILPRGTTAIASFGRAKRQPVARGDQVVISAVMAVSGTFDHRAVDGGPGMRFLHAIIEALEEPALLHA